MSNEYRVLITGPVLTGHGGVANYYSAVLPHLQGERCCRIKYIEIGRREESKRSTRPIEDQIRVSRLIHNFQPDVVHVNPSLDPKSFFRDAVFAAIAKRSGARVLVFFRGWDDHFATKVGRWLRGFFQLTFGRADAFIVLAESARQNLRRWGVNAPIDLDTTVVPDELVDSFRLSEKLDFLKKQETTKILFMARLESTKGIFETIDATSDLNRKGKSVSLTVAGDGGAMPAIQERLKKDRLAGANVELEGYVTGAAKRRLLETHHLYCLPSYHGEGMPNAMLEAMAFGMPIVTCPVGGIVDMFLDGEMGLLVPPRNPKAISLAIKEISHSWSKYAAMAACNHDYATSHALASQAADRLISQYGKLVGS